jgi:hypothetical protein
VQCGRRLCAFGHSDALEGPIGRGGPLQRDRRLARDRVQHSFVLVGTDVVAAIHLEHEDPIAATGGAAGARDKGRLGFHSKPPFPPPDRNLRTVRLSQRRNAADRRREQR